MIELEFKNPFTPGAGHMPPYLAGRVKEEKEFRKLLSQDRILENLILTGLRGVGKTVLAEKFKPIAIQENWLWVGTDLSETTSVTEANLAIRIITDLSVVTSSIRVPVSIKTGTGFNSSDEIVYNTLNFQALISIYESTPGLNSDKLKAVLEKSWDFIRGSTKKGIIFAYDEAQTLADHAAKDQFPLSMLLDVFQSLQRKGIPFMLALVGLPTLFPKLVEARTYAERMFRVVSLDQLNEEDSREAITMPVRKAECPITFSEESVKSIIILSGGYPYFIQFICREVFDTWIQRLSDGQDTSIPEEEILRKLDSDFFAGRWAKATDRQRELLYVIACLDTANSEFSVQEIADKSNIILCKGFSNSHINQMLLSLTNSGLVYKNRHGKYSFAVPLMSGFVLRQDRAQFSIQKPETDCL